MAERVMRAKMAVNKVERHQNVEILTMSPVCKPDGYPTDGRDEDNTFARFSPAGSLSLTVANPDLFGKINPGDKYYLDFTKAES